MKNKETRFGKKLGIIFMVVSAWCLLALSIIYSIASYKDAQMLEQTCESVLEQNLSNITSLLSLGKSHTINILSTNNVQILQYGKSDARKKLAARLLLETLGNEILLQPNIAGFQFFFDDGRHWYYSYQEGYSKDVITFIRNHTREEINLSPTPEWKLVTYEDDHFLLFSYTQNEVTFSIIIHLDLMISNAGDYQGKQMRLFWLADDKLLSREDIFDTPEAIQSLTETCAYRSGEMLAFAMPAPDTPLMLGVVIPKDNNFTGYPLLSVIIIIFLASVLLIIYCYINIRRTFIVPLNLIYDSILSIQEKGILQSINVRSGIYEYHQIVTSFNQLMDQVGLLKIQSYEDKLQKQKAQFQYLQLQIRPHFFLNCLKTFYALLQQEKYDKLGNMIINTSKYFRYIFRNNSETVLLKEELEFSQSYIQLQQHTALITISYTVHADESLWNMKTVPLAIQTFLENSVKYSGNQDELSLDVSIMKLKGENQEYLDITVTDNGHGYSEQWVKKINQIDSDQESEHTGILNLKKRLRFIFGPDVNLSVWNHHGAVTEIIYPISNHEIS